jgi:hypothetical protein
MTNYAASIPVNASAQFSNGAFAVLSGTIPESFSATLDASGSGVATGVSSPATLNGTVFFAGGSQPFQVSLIPFAPVTFNVLNGNFSFKVTQSGVFGGVSQTDTTTISGSFSPNQTTVFASGNEVLSGSDQGISFTGTITGSGTLSATTPVTILPTEADMILRRGDGSYEIYAIANNAIQLGTALGQVGTDYQFAGLGNFSSSGSTDMVLRSGSTGHFEVYNIRNHSLAGAASLGSVGLNWQLAGFGSFNAPQSTTGMMLRDVNTGSFELYQINNNAITGAAAIGAVGLEWQVAGFGDFNGDGTTDMMLRNASAGTFEVYNISYGQLTSAHNLGAVGLDWQMAGFGNFHGPGTSSDMMLRNATTGMFELYTIRNNTIAGATAIGAVGLDWRVAGFADFNGDGTTDMMLRNTGTGTFEAYDILNGQLASAHSIGAVGLDWQIAGFSTQATAAAQSQVLQLTQAMSSFGTASEAPMTAAPLASADSPQSFLATPQHAVS